MGIDEPWLRDTVTALRRHRGDTTDIEVKAAAGGYPENAAQTICAFANMPGGGTVIFGVDERTDFSVVGVYNAAKCEAAFAAQARDAIDPPPYVETQTLEIDSKQVVVGTVRGLPMSEKPACYRGEAYLRQADGDYKMAPYELRMIEAAKLGLDEQKLFDAQPVSGTARKDLNDSIVDEYVTAFRSNRMRRHSARASAIDMEDLLRLTGVIDADGVPTVAGLYAMGIYPQGFIPALRVDAAVNLPRGEEGRTIKNLEVFEGPLPTVFADLLDWVRENLSTVRRYRASGDMVVEPEIPMNAVRELLANALVHRDLSPETLGNGKFVHVRLLPDRLVIQNPGGLRGVTREQIESPRDHAQAAVNQRLYAIAQLLQTSSHDSIIEGEGGGIQEVFESCREAGLQRPLLVDTGVEFRAILFRPTDDVGSPKQTSVAPPEMVAVPEPSNADMNSSGSRDVSVPERIQARFRGITSHGAEVGVALLQHGESTLDEVSQYTGLSIAQARYALNTLRQAGYVEMFGGRGYPRTTYRLASRSSSGSQCDGE
ncbi:ATP-binding protein [Neoactinobaculum massilliense]|uniref:ATP-binding protein n=1 Tax=Neoactinobaculum massilliense TaxID=2364794 RepID=UPI000F527990|nr:RNA-binding domain-containing protein [Neoactinobaculum massilliense]